MTSRRRAPVKKKAAPAAKLRRYGDQALERLAWLMQHAESEQAQVAAAKELLERAGGGGMGGSAGGEAPQDLGDVVDRLRRLREKP